MTCHYHHSIHNAPVVDENDNDDDDFGDFEAPEVPATTSSVQETSTTLDAFGGFNPNATPATVPLSSALDELGSSHDVPLPSLEHNAPVVDENDNKEEDDDEFGDFEAPVEVKEDAFPGFDKHKETPDIAPLSLALDELGPTMDAPLPSLDAVVAIESKQVVDVNVEDEIDEFGNFVAPSAESILSHDEPLKQDEKDAFSGFKEAAAAPVVPLSSALDELGSSHDAPLPSLDTFAVVSEQQRIEDDDDGFGDFEDAPNNNNNKEEEVESTAKKEGDLVYDTTVSTLPSNGGKTDEFVDFVAPKEATTSLSSALDSLGAIQDAPLPPLGVPLQPQGSDGEDDDEFGDFEAPSVGVQEADALDSDNAPCTPLTVSEQQAQQCDTVEVQKAALDPLSSALDSLGPTQDAPLPSLGFTESQQREESDNDDDFGEFNGVLPSGTESSDDPLTSANAGFGPSVDEPLPSLESHTQNAAPKVSDIEADEFGSFEAPPENGENICIGESGSETGIQEAASEQTNVLASSQDNAVEPSQDEPLPSADSQPLDLSSDLCNDGNEASKEVENISSATIDNDDPFASAFDAIAPVENSPLPSFGMHKVVHEIDPAEELVDSQETDFGSVEGPLATETAGPDDRVQVTNHDAEEPMISERSNYLTESTNSSDPFVSAFDTIAPVEDVPLPALGSGDLPTEETAGHVANIEGETHRSEDDEDGFGSFEDATGTEDGVETQEPEQVEKVIEDDAYDQDADTRVPKERTIAKDLFSNAVAPIDEPLPTFHSASGSDFSGFETASENITSEEKKGEVETLDDFGGFSGACPPAVNGTEESNEAVPSDPMNSDHDDGDDDDDFGDFTAIEAPVEAASGFNAEWGDFEESSGVETSEDKLPNEVPTTTTAIQPEFAVNVGTATPDQSEVDDEFGDFGSFQEIEHPSTEKEETLEDIAIRVQEMQKTLTIQHNKGGQVDFVKMFQENIQVNKPASGWRLAFNKQNAQKPVDPAESLKRGQRCCQVMMLLTTSNTSSLNHWEKIFNVVRDELAMGSFLLEEAKSIAGENAVYSALGMWVAGLGEYVRVTRSIAATLCDLLCLDIDVDVFQMKNIHGIARFSNRSGGSLDKSARCFERTEPSPAQA